MASWTCRSCGNVTLSVDVQSFSNKCAICGESRGPDRELRVDGEGYCREVVMGRMSAKLFRITQNGLGFYDKESKRDVVVSIREIGELMRAHAPS